MEGRNWSMYGLAIDVTELWLRGLVGLNIRCTSCNKNVDSVSGQTAYHVKRCNELQSGLF